MTFTTSDLATLASLTVSGAHAGTRLCQLITSYGAIVPYATSQHHGDSGAPRTPAPRVKINGVPVASGAASGPLAGAGRQ